MEHFVRQHQNGQQLIFATNKRAIDRRFYGSLIRICDLLSMGKTESGSLCRRAAGEAGGAMRVD